ncbi:polycystin-2 isoform X2 [Patella vulgata]|nr:polycystin-2 isoform X2 [Patella vulgata]XP_055956039.1 polycystin-2-like isoform X2 [Patella vulgata]XP_055956484.1 polycystin-2 isoform X2 [Patella vulgata]
METRLFTNRFDKIINRTHFMAWTKYNLLPEAFATYNFNGGLLNWREKLFFSDMANFRVGPLRIRQIRTKERPAPDLGLLFGKKFGGLLGNRSYYWSYTGDHEDTNDYCIGWKTPPCSIEDKATSITVPAWEYTSSGEAWGLPVTGNIDIYGGGGYFFDMDINYDASVNMFNQLYDNLWLDRQTRAVFVEFSLYNADSNLLIVVRIIAEFPEYGGTVKWHHINTLRIFQHVTAMGLFVIACEIVVFIIMIILTGMAVKGIKKDKWNYFKDFWHIIDVLSIIIAIFGFTIFVLKEVYLSRTLSKFKENPKKFVNFEHVVWFDFAFVVAVAFLLFLTTLGMLRVLGYNKRITIIASVLKRAARDLSGFGTLFGIIFLGFVSTGYVLFYSHINEFRTLFDVITTLITYTLGKNHLAEMLMVSPSIAPIYFALFVFFVTFVLLTMFQAILNIGLVTVRESLKSDEQPFGIVDILLGIYRSVLTDWFPDSWSKSNDKENDDESRNVQSKNDEESGKTKSKNDEESRRTQSKNMGSVDYNAEKRMFFID